MMFRSILACALVAAPLAAAADAKEDAQRHIASATEAHSQHNFALALTELEAAYALDPLPDLLFAIGQVHVQLGQCPEAIAQYERFLATQPPPQAAADTREAVKSCAAVSPVDPPPPAEPPPMTSPPPVVEQPITTTPWFKDKVGGALVVTGVAASAAAIVLYVGARSDLDDAEAASSLAGYQDLVESATSKRNLSIIFGVGGSVLLGAGVARYVLRRTSPRESRVGLTPARGGGLVTWSGGF